ncbi:MAG: thioredoxin family protein [Candidatus Thorarchaeota archaeon]
MVEEINADQLDKVISENKVVFVDCHALWCQPCKALTPIMAELQEKYAEKGLRVVKINTDDNREFSASNQITGIPSVIVFAEGKKVVFDDGSGKTMDKLVGVMPPEVYDQIAENLLSEAKATA